MRPRDRAREIFEIVDFADHGQTPGVDPEEIAERLAGIILEDAGPDPDDQHELLWLIGGEIDRTIRIARSIRKAIDQLRTIDIETNGAIRLADEAWYTGRAGGWKIIDRDRLVAWLDTAEDLAAAFRLDDGNLRKTALEGIAEKRLREWDTAHSDVEDLTDDELADRVQAVLDTFLEWVPTGDAGDRKLQSVPARDRKWARELAHGERRGGKRQTPPVE